MNLFNLILLGVNGWCMAYGHHGFLTTANSVAFGICLAVLVRDIRRDE